MGKEAVCERETLGGGLQLQSGLPMGIAAVSHGVRQPDEGEMMGKEASPLKELMQPRLIHLHAISLSGEASFVLAYSCSR